MSNIILSAKPVFSKILLKTGLLLLISLAVFAQKGKTLVYDNQIYEPYIKTPLLYPFDGTNNVQATLNPPVIGLNNNQNLKLEFDCLNPAVQNFRVKIFHCNADWQPSSLNEIEYLSEYNDIPIYDYYNSFATKIQYNHFGLILPKVRVSGNFIVIVYKNRNEKDIVLSRRFQVYDSRVSVGGKIVFSNVPDKRRTHQQVNFAINYSGYEILDPKNDLKIIIRQNFRDNKTLKNLQPFMVDNFNRKLDYQFFDGENSIEGINEFRLFDIRSSQQKLVGISHIFYGDKENVFELFTDKPQNGLAYVDTKDFDGMFVIDNYETNKGATEADYVRVSFQLKTDSLINKKVYILGAYNDWKLNETNQMHYVPESSAYESFIQLKQGIYNFQYITVDNKGIINERDIEGSHSQTENSYEIFVYHQSIGGRADSLVGYSLIKSR